MQTVARFAYLDTQANQSVIVFLVNKNSSRSPSCYKGRLMRIENQSQERTVIIKGAKPMRLEATDSIMVDHPVREIGVWATKDMTETISEMDME